MSVHPKAIPLKISQFWICFYELVAEKSSGLRGWMPPSHLLWSLLLVFFWPSQANQGIHHYPRKASQCAATMKFPSNLVFAEPCECLCICEFSCCFRSSLSFFFRASTSWAQKIHGDEKAKTWDTGSQDGFSPDPFHPLPPSKPIALSLSWSESSLKVSKFTSVQAWSSQSKSSGASCELRSGIFKAILVAI